MLRSRHPHSPTSDQAVRDLIDERARASHTRYTSVSYSQRSDSPSIYSRAEYSPNTQTPPQDWLHTGYQTSLAGQDRSSFEEDDEDARTSYTRNSFYHDDQSSFPPADDDISVISALTPRPPLLHPNPVPSAARDLDAVTEGSPSEETEEDTRMSMLGPKMRFVSKAPWELGNGLLEEEQEQPGSATDALSTFGNKMSTWRSRDQDKSSAKGLGLTTRSRSPGPLPASGRKSSGGTNGMYRQQTRESQRGPYGPHLSGASQSHGAIPSTVTSSSRSTHSGTDSLSSDRSPHGRARAASPAEPFPFPTHPFRAQNISYSSRGGSAPSIRSASPSPSDRYVHPYANPDLLPTATSAPPAPLPRTPATSQERAADERENQTSPLRRASESTSSSSSSPPPPHTTNLRKASAGGIPLAGMPPRTLFGEQDGRADTSHIAARPKARSSSRPIPSSPMRSMVPYGDQPGSPMYNLITLEQARARAQNVPNRGQARGQSGDTENASTPSSTLVAGLGLAAGVIVDNGVVRGQMQRQDFSYVPPSDPSPQPSMQDQKNISHPRPRTASSGKHMFGGGSGTAADDDAVPAKTLKHKKSAFMKLFQGKEKDRDRDAKASDYPIRSMSTPPQLPPANDSAVPPLPSTALHNIKRVPPPLPLSVVVTSPSFPASGSPPQPDQQEPCTRSASPPRLRQASAPLPASSHGSAQTSAQGPWLAASESQPSGTLNSSLSRPATSAPPSQTAFQALSLRPVSTIFSAKFPDLLAPASPPGTPSASSTLRRAEDPPLPTPGFSYSRSNSTSTVSDSPVTPTSLPLVGPPSLGVIQGEDPSNVIVSLQEQIVSSRKMWQRQIWELEGQIRDLKAEVKELRSTGECDTCGAAKREGMVRAPVPQNVGVVDRPRPRLGGGNTRTVFGGGCDM